MNYLIIVVIAILIIYVISRFLKRKNTFDNTVNQKTEYPDRSFNIGFFQSKIAQGIESEDYELANLNYAKLVESVRQQNINENGALQKELENIQDEYKKFRAEYNLEYPQQFLPPSERGKKEKPSKISNADPSELLKKATAFSKTDMKKAIALIKEAIQIEPENFSAHKKLANYMFQDGMKTEAINYLQDYSQNCYVLHKANALDQVAILYKKDKNLVDAIKFDCYSNYYATIINNPLAFYDFESYCDSICLNRNYKKIELETKVNNQLIDYWGKEWLSNYYHKYNEIDKAESYDIDKTIKKLKPNIEEKNFNDFINYINNLVDE